MSMDYIKAAITFLDDYEKDGGLEQAIILFGEANAIAPRALEQYNSLVNSLREVLGLAVGLGDDDPYFFDKRNGETICNKASSVLDIVEKKEE